MWGPCLHPFLKRPRSSLLEITIRGRRARSSWFHQGRRACSWAEGRPPPPARLAATCGSREHLRGPWESDVVARRISLQGLIAARREAGAPGWAAARGTCCSCSRVSAKPEAGGDNPAAAPEAPLFLVPSLPLASGRDPGVGVGWDRGPSLGSSGCLPSGSSSASHGLPGLPGGPKEEPTRRGESSKAPGCESQVVRALGSLQEEALSVTTAAEVSPPCSQCRSRSEGWTAAPHARAGRVLIPGTCEWDPKWERRVFAGAAKSDHLGKPKLDLNPRTCVLIRDGEGPHEGGTDGRAPGPQRGPPPAPRRERVRAVKPPSLLWQRQQTSTGNAKTCPHGVGPAPGRRPATPACAF